MITVEDLKKHCMSVALSFPHVIQEVLENHGAGKHPDMPITGPESTDFEHTEFENTVPAHGNKRAHLSPTQVVVPQLPAPSGGEKGSKCGQKAKVQSETADAGGKK
eukprot:11702033-Karenia_brevis.AAC.1